MNYESIKEEFIKLKKEELSYIDTVVKTSCNRILSEYEKLEIYRKINNFQIRLDELLKMLRKELRKHRDRSADNLSDILIEIDVDENYLSSIEDEVYRRFLFKHLGINFETYKFNLTLSNLIHYQGYTAINPDRILNNQKIIENPIYIFSGYYDSSEEFYGPCFGNPDDYIYGIYVDICDTYNSNQSKIPKKEMPSFEKDKTIIYAPKNVSVVEIRGIFETELLNTQNKTLNDCVIATKKRIEELDYVRSYEYKKKGLLDRINELAKKVKGEFIQEEVLYSGSFLEILREIYTLPNGKTVKKEKIVKNGGKDAVIVIAITQDKKYILAFQNRIKDKTIAEFSSGYIEKDEDPIAAAKRELREETGYISDDLFIVDEAFTSPGIDNSVTYIVVANNCVKTDELKTDGDELVTFGLFSELELKYLVSNNIMSGAMNKLAYYNLITNVDDCNIIYAGTNKRIYKRQRKNANSQL